MNEFYLASNEIKKTSYYYNENNKKLNIIDKLKKNRFEVSGENLTVCILNLNRVKLTIKLLSSIEYYFEGFLGNILIIDNGSASDQLIQLKEYIQTCTLKIKIHELGVNHGVGRARNIAAELIDTEWIMFIDNDMYFIKNPLESIKDTIYSLGCKFLNLPLINYDNKTAFALGGALYPYIGERESFIGAGSCFDFKRSVETDEIEIEAPFLSDFLFGGASVVDRQAFLDQGGFDYDMFVGFEDIDFSLRLYNEGYKVGNIPAFTLIHNHKPSENVDDIQAEKERFNNQIIKDSADAFFNKNGILVYDKGTEEWLKLREQELNLSKKDKIDRVNKSVNKKPRVALVADIEGWAFHNIANNIIKQLSDKYEFDIYFHSMYTGENWLDLFPILYEKKHDVVVVFWRPIVKHLFSLDLKNYLEYTRGISGVDFAKYLNDTVIITGVYDHLFLKDTEVEDYKEVYTNNVDGYFVASNLLKNIYENIPSYPNPYTVIQDGIAPDMFFKKEDKRFSEGNAPLVVGWAGNSKWGWDVAGIDHKGFITIIRPAILELQEEGYSIELVYADKQEPATHIPSSEMNDFYNGLDLYICASDIEGTPNPVLESMACGIGVISTNVGIVSEVLGRKQKQFILKDRSKLELKEKLKYLISNRYVLHELAEENQIRIKHWTWESKCERFDEMFEYYLFKHKNGKNKLKTFPFSVANESFELSQLVNVLDFSIPSESNQGETMEYAMKLNELKEVHHMLNKQYNTAMNRFSFYEENYFELKKWYHKEYEVLPLWYKRIGHIIKAFKGEKTFKSLMVNSEVLDYNY